MERREVGEHQRTGENSEGLKISMESKVPRQGSRTQFVRSVLEGAVLTG